MSKETVEAIVAAASELSRTNARFNSPKRKSEYKLYNAPKNDLIKSI